MIICAMLLIYKPAYAQGRVALVRDAQTENLIRAYVAPILKAAGLRKGAVEVLLVNDKSFNAFVTGRRMVLNTGALISAETPNEIIGVIAHETGHIVGGHQNRLRQRLETAKALSVVAGLVGLGVTVGSVASGNDAAARAGVGIASGGQEAAIRDLLAYQRSEERAADIAAVRLLNATGQSGAGLLATFQRFQTALNLSGARPNKYKRSHPLPRERLLALEKDVKNSPHFSKKDSKGLQLAHDLVRAKLVAYTGSTQERSRFEAAFRGQLPALYANAISTFLYQSPRAALPKMDALIKKAPRNPYFHEMKGEILLRSARPKEAAAAFKKAVGLDSNRAGILRTQLGHALLEIGDPESIKSAITELNKGLTDDKTFAQGYFYLARAHGALGQTTQAELAAAQGAYIAGDLKQAKRFASRAKSALKKGSAGWLKADDILKSKK